MPQNAFAYALPFLSQLDNGKSSDSKMSDVHALMRLSRSRGTRGFFVTASPIALPG
jgi:hypothetical protein